MAATKRIPLETRFVTRPEFAELRADFLETKHEVRALTQSVGALTVTVGTLVETVGALGQSVATLSADVRELRDEVRAQGVKIENVVMVEIRALGDGLRNANESFGRQLTELEVRLGDRIGILEGVVRMNSVDIQKNSVDIQKNSVDIQKNSADIQKNSADIQKNSADIQRLSREVAQLRNDFEHRSERQVLAGLEVRVTALEERAGIAKG